MYQHLLFDLDGTLTDPGLGITNSVMFALKKFGIEVQERASLYKFIGPPLLDSFRDFYGFSTEDSELAVRYYREYFSRQGLFENEVYDGVPTLLARLKQSGRTLIVASSKPEVYVVEILKHFDLYRYFDLVAGATMDQSRSQKADVIRYALSRAGIRDPSSALMIGDRKHDILGARENGLDALGVLFGYGSREELKAAGAAFLAETPADIERCLSSAPFKEA